MKTIRWPLFGCGLVLVAGAVDPAGADSTLMGSSRNGDLIAIDPSSGASILVGVLPSEATEIEIDNATGRAFVQRPLGATEGREFDVANGAAIGPAVPNGRVFTGLEVVSGTWYGASITTSGGASELRTLDPFTGASTLVGPTGVSGPIAGLAHDGSTMYGIEGGSGPANLYTIDLGTGTATLVGSTGIQAGSLQFGRDGTLYAGGTGLNQGDLFTIDPTTGASTLVGATGFGTGPSNGITGLTLVDNIHFACSTELYAGDGAGALPGNLYVINPATGAVSSTVGPIGAPVTGLAAHPVTCALWGATSLRFDIFDNPNPGHLIRVDRTTGAGTLVGDIVPGTDFGPADITFGPDGTLYGWSTDSDDLVTIDLGTGAGTEVGDSGLSITIGNGLASSRAGELFLVPDGAELGGTLQKIDPATGLVTSSIPLTGDLVSGSAINALGFSCSGGLYGSRSEGTAGAGPTTLVWLDAATAALSSVGALPNRIDALAWACPADTGTDFFTVDPCRVLDTRNAAGPLGGPALASGTARIFPVAGTCGIPSSARAISINVAVTGATAPGNVRLHAGRTSVPLVSTINYGAGQTRSNNGVVPLNELGELSAFSGQASGVVHLIIDVNGYFQ